MTELRAMKVLMADCEKHGRTRVVFAGDLVRTECCSPADFRRLTEGKKPDARQVPRAGESIEAALYQALDAAGFADFGRGVSSDTLSRFYMRQYPWGAYLSPPRRFCADAAFPVARLLVEVEGIVHSVQSQRRADVVRRQLAEAAGWRVLSVLPEQVKSGEAVELVRRAPGGRLMEPRYLGDGVYASFDGYHLVLDLRAQGQGRIALEPSVLRALDAYRKAIADTYGAPQYMPTSEDQ